MPTLGLVLSGGGARGAYQAGVLAAHPSNFVASSKNLVNLWSNIDSDHVFYADLMALSRGGLQWMTELSLGSRGKDGTALRSLLSTHPLNSLLTETCKFPEIQRKITDGDLRAVSVSALDYDSISTVTFFQGRPELQSWERGMHRSERAMLGVEHVMASSAIPLLFPPIYLGADREFPR